MISMITALGMILSACGRTQQSASDASAPARKPQVQAAYELPETSYSREEILLENEGQRIYGVAYIPDSVGRKPLVILSHGLGGSYTNCLEEAEQLASHGFAAYAFDFRGGGGSRSEGSTTQMSVMTEVSDLEAVMEAAKEWEFADPEKITLMGFSQGGIVSAITAARHVEDVAGLILCYPAFLVGDAVHDEFDSLDDVPDTYFFTWIRAGRIYTEDMWDYDVYEEIGNYTKPVLLMHGDRDGIVPISYAERAAEVYPDVDYHVIKGGGHGFSARAFDECMELSFEYLERIGITGR